MEAAGVPNQPTEEAGITDEIIKKLQEKATVLTQERKKRGRTVPEDLIDQESLKGFKTLASHPVSNIHVKLINCLSLFNLNI
jgi:pre-mRNA-processing factor 19